MLCWIHSVKGKKRDKPAEGHFEEKNETCCQQQDGIPKSAEGLTFGWRPNSIQIKSQNLEKLELCIL